RTHLVPRCLVKRPITHCAYVCGSLQPARWRDDVLTPVAIHVAGSDTVTKKSWLTDHVFDPFAVLNLVPGCRQVCRTRELRQELQRLAVIIEIDEKSEFGRTD